MTMKASILIKGANDELSFEGDPAGGGGVVIYNGEGNVFVTLNAPMCAFLSGWLAHAGGVER